jgi:hypothetical protein
MHGERKTRDLDGGRAMNREELDRELDEWLDRAVEEFGKTEIKPGFETRIMANINSRLEKRAGLFHWVPVAVAIAVVLFCLIYLTQSYIRNRENTQIASIQGPNSNPQQLLKQAPETSSAAGNAKLIPAGVHAIRPRLAFRSRAETSEKPGGHFLSSGLSDQERYLIAFARAASEREISGLSEIAGFEPQQTPSFTLPSFEFPPFAIESNDTNP